LATASLLAERRVGTGHRMWLPVPGNAYAATASAIASATRTARSLSRGARAEPPRRHRDRRYGPHYRLSRASASPISGRPDLGRAEAPVAPVSPRSKRVRPRLGATAFPLAPATAALSQRRHPASWPRATSTPTRRSLPRRAGRRRRWPLTACRRPGDCSQTRGAVLGEGAALPRLSESGCGLAVQIVALVTAARPKAALFGLIRSGQRWLRLRPACPSAARRRQWPSVRGVHPRPRGRG
jgi:hypothetical protein